MSQRTHLDDFLRSRIIGGLECGCTQLEVSEKLINVHNVLFRLWQRFQDDGNVIRRYSTGHTRVETSIEDPYLTVTAKKTQMEHNIRPILSALLSHWYDSFNSESVQPIRED
ncbi:uncharacterized protein TNCV_5053071 [Trichonephila clavipes]|nr:uncharacterized protein TNCV_5053071 [Trichonephila clavipes]